MAKTLSEMLYERMENRCVRQADLCRGLCSTSAMSRYLRGERRIDRMLLTAFMQRLGMSPDKFTTLLTEPEYYYFEWKQEIVLAQIRGDYKKVERLLKDDAAVDRECNEILQEQFYLMLNGIVVKQLYGDNEKSEKFFYEAIKLTIPYFSEKFNMNTLFCLQEINALILWLEVQPDKRKKLELYEYLISYVTRQYKDLEVIGFKVEEFNTLYQECPSVFDVPDVNKRLRCSGGVAGAALCADGILKICSAAPTDEKFIIGNIKELPLEYIWNHPNEYIRKYRLEKNVTQTECKKCKSRKNCKSKNCRLYAYAYYKNIKSASPIACYITKLNNKGRKDEQE